MKAVKRGVKRGSKKLKRIMKGGQTPTAGNSIYSGGGTSRAYINGNISVAKYNEPWGITKDSNGNMYITDKGNNCIRKITTSGEVTTFVGVQDDAANIQAKIRVPVNPGYVNAQGTAAKLRRPQGIVCDNNNNLYFVETDNHVVRKIDPSGNVTTFAGPPATTSNSGGQTIRGFVNGASATATFNQPFDITIDSRNNLYVADNQNNAIRKIDSTGTVTTFAGGSSGNTNGKGTAAKFKFPYGVVCDPSDNVYVADYMNGAIRKITPDGTVTTVAGGSGLGYVDGNGTAAKLRPVGLTLGPNNTLIVSDGDPEKNAPAGTAHRIRIIDLATSNVSTLAGSGSQTLSTTQTSTNTDSSNLLNITLSNPTCMLYNSAINKLFIVNTGTLNPPNPNPFLGNYIYAMDLTLKVKYKIRTLAGGTLGKRDGTGTEARFHKPIGLALTSNEELIVTDTVNNIIRKITHSGVVSTIAGSDYGFIDGPAATAKFSNPTGVTVSTNGDIYITDPYNNRIRKISPDGVVSTIAGTGVAGSINADNMSSTFNIPYGLTLEANGNLIVTEFLGSRIRRVPTVPGGTVFTIAGNGNVWYSDGSGETAYVGRPLAAVSYKNALFIADTFNHRIRKMVGNTLTSLTGSKIPVTGLADGYVDGDASNAKFNEPSGIAVDKNGNIFVSDTNNNCIRMISTSGKVSTLQQEDKTNYVSSKPYGIVVDSKDNVYVVENEKSRIIVMSPIYYIG
uniref:SMP-30/Gluconolactonase/LRE-like region domain-containing protein n=1 Tax=viral metagenome TaxID=1070528 RepID=A0A6C0K7T4_9ZZZZ